MLRVHNLLRVARAFGLPGERGDSIRIRNAHGTYVAVLKPMSDPFNAEVDVYLVGRPAAAISSASTPSLLKPEQRFGLIFVSASIAATVLRDESRVTI